MVCLALRKEFVQMEFFWSIFDLFKMNEYGNADEDFFWVKIVAKNAWMRLLVTLRTLKPILRGVVKTGARS